MPAMLLLLFTLGLAEEDEEEEEESLFLASFPSGRHVNKTVDFVNEDRHR